MILPVYGRQSKLKPYINKLLNSQSDVSQRVFCIYLKTLVSALLVTFKLDDSWQRWLVLVYIAKTVVLFSMNVLDLNQEMFIMCGNLWLHELTLGAFPFRYSFSLFWNILSPYALDFRSCIILLFSLHLFGSQFFSKTTERFVHGVDSFLDTIWKIWSDLLDVMGIDCKLNTYNDHHRAPPLTYTSILSEVTSKFSLFFFRLFHIHFHLSTSRSFSIILHTSHLIDLQG